MLWFEGSMSEAIAEYKRIKSVFVVYIRGNDEQTKKMDIVWNDEQINAVFSKDCTAVKLDVDSVEGKNFASIYPVICIPCTFFIDGVGTPSEVVGGYLSAEQFLEKAKQAIQKHRIQFPKIETVSSPSTSTAQSLPSQRRDEPVEERNDSNPALTERVTRAKKLREENRREMQEKEDAKKKELERRKEGQQLTKDKTKKEDNLGQQIAERVKMEKAKTEAAREVVRQKIQQDKLERMASEEIEKEKRRSAASRIDPHVNTSDSVVQQPPIDSSVPYSNKGFIHSSPIYSGGTTTVTNCKDLKSVPDRIVGFGISKSNNSQVRLQFRLPDGSTVTENFPADSTLEAARQFICSRIDFRKTIALWTLFPRKLFGDEDYLKTLTELSLNPSAALVVDLSSANSSMHSGYSTASSISSAITWLLAPLLALFSILKFFLFASPQQHQGAEQQNVQSTSATNASGSSSPTPHEVRRRTRDSDKKEENFKKEGKIHSFKQDDSDDDENKTWNGNSTQQM